MNRRVEAGARGAAASFWDTTLAAGRDVGSHWMLAILSLLSAGAIWFVIQDIENPRVTEIVPLESESQGIPVEFVNLSPEYVVAETARVRVRVEAREGEILELRPGDFRATVDLQGIQGEALVSLPVTVSALDDGVTVLSVEPDRVEVQLLAVEEREFEVEVNLTGQLPAGFEESGSDARVINPAFVIVSGREELVDNVDRVEIDVNLSGQRESFEVTGDLVARNSNGDRQAVTISSPRATVEFSIEPLFIEKTLPVRPRTTGDPVDGYAIGDITTDPSLITVSGPKDDVDPLTELSLEPLDISGASSTVTQTRGLLLPPNVTARQESVIVEVTLNPIVCGANNPVPQCAGALFYATPTFRDLPAGLQVAVGSYAVPVRVSGPLTSIRELDPRSIIAVITFAGAAAGEAMYTATVTLPEPVRVENVSPIPVTLTGETP